MATLATQISIHLNKTHEAIRKHVKFRSNVEPTLYDDFYWSEVERIAKKKKEEARKNLVDQSVGETGFKALKKGDHDIADYPHFKTMVRVSAPSRSFDFEVFVDKLLVKYPKLSRAKIAEVRAASYVSKSASRAIKTTEK